tara:strand:- start:1506 stop:2363 length:858 start_codon:yes stop_codon:yes gene_type:complete
MSRTNTPFLTGYAVKPNVINEVGIVTFTDGTNEITPNQQQCEAYGFTYNPTTGTCRAFTYNTELGKSLRKETNNVQGSNNVAGVGTDNSYVMGENNTIEGDAKNNIIIGSGNNINLGLQSANVFGTLGEATADNSIVLGGNAGSDNLAERQSIQVLYGTQTTAASEVDSYLNNTTDSYFAVPENTILYFNADVVAVRVGGTDGSGAVGDYASWIERGVIINESGTLTINREKDAIKDSGGAISNWRPRSVASGTNYVLKVRGEADQTIEWCANIIFTQIKTGVAL